MVKEFSTISELKTIREQKSRLSERENELSAPALYETELIPVIYGWFGEILNGMDFPPLIESVNQRKKFIFIILFLFAPSVLAGGRMPNGLRDMIAEAINLKNVTFISHNIETVVFLHQHDKYFRKDIEYIYTEIVNRLKVEGLIK